MVGSNGDMYAASTRTRMYDTKLDSSDRTCLAKKQDYGLINRAYCVPG